VTELTVKRLGENMTPLISGNSPFKLLGAAADPDTDTVGKVLVNHHAARQYNLLPIEGISLPASLSSIIEPKLPCSIGPEGGTT
jgi:hypothetical protein